MEYLEIHGSQISVNYFNTVILKAHDHKIKTMLEANGWVQCSNFTTLPALENLIVCFIFRQLLVGLLFCPPMVLFYFTKPPLLVSFVIIFWTIFWSTSTNLSPAQLTRKYFCFWKLPWWCLQEKRIQCREERAMENQISRIKGDI